MAAQFLGDRLHHTHGAPLTARNITPLLSNQAPRRLVAEPQWVLRPVCGRLVHETARYFLGFLRLGAAMREAQNCVPCETALDAIARAWRFCSVIA